MGFKSDFLWGAATASYQIEGGFAQGGKGESVWDAFSHQPDAIFEGQTGDEACDHYHRFREDVALMASLGVKNYRFSISWTRLFPNGTGAPNEAGAAFYDQLIDCLLEHGIRPFVTLFHWDYPLALERRGGWCNPQSPDWFADYAAFCALRYGDRVKDFITFNEPQCFIGLGYGTGAHAPGFRYPTSELILMAHNVLKAHGLSVQALRRNVPGVRVSYAPCGDAKIPVTEADIDAAREVYFAASAFPFSVSWWSDPVILGKYPEDGLQLFEKYLPTGWEKDLKTICQPLDFYCQNIYNGQLVRKGKTGAEIVPWPRGTARTGMGWYVSPDALYWGPRFLYERYHLPILMTENGMSNLDTISLDGKVHDPQREDYLHRYLLAYRRAAEDGVELMGYFQWSLMDNFEWANGYHDRFGIIYVDYATQKRIPKDSAYWYQEVMRLNGENL